MTNNLMKREIVVAKHMPTFLARMKAVQAADITAIAAFRMAAQAIGLIASLAHLPALLASGVPAVAIGGMISCARLLTQVAHFVLGIGTWEIGLLASSLDNLIRNNRHS